MPSTTHERSTSKQLRAVVPASMYPSEARETTVPFLDDSAAEVEARLLALLRERYSPSGQDLGMQFVMPSVAKLPEAIAKQVETSTLETYFNHYKEKKEAPLGFVKFVAGKQGFAPDVVLAYVSTFGVEDEEEMVPFDIEATTLDDYESHLAIEVARTARNRKQAAQQGFSNSCGKALACMSNEAARTQAIFSFPESVDLLDADWENEIQALEGESLKDVMSFFKSAFKACLQAQATMLMSTTQQQWKDYEDLKTTFFGGTKNQKEELLESLGEAPDNMVRKLVTEDFKQKYKNDLPQDADRPKLQKLQNQLTLRERAYQQAFSSTAQHDQMVSPLTYPSVGMAAAACSQAIPVPALGGFFSPSQTASPMFPYGSQLPTPPLPFGAASFPNPFSAFSPMPPAPVDAVAMKKEQKTEFVKVEPKKKRKSESAQGADPRRTAGPSLEQLTDFAQKCADLAGNVRREIENVQAQPEPLARLLPTSELKQSILGEMLEVKTMYDKLNGKTSGASSSSDAVSQNPSDSPSGDAPSSSQVDPTSPSSSSRPATFEDCFKTLKTMQQYLTKRSKTSAIQNSPDKDSFERHLASFVDELNQAVDKLKQNAADLQKKRKEMEKMEQKAVRDKRAKEEKAAKQIEQQEEAKRTFLSKTFLLQPTEDACGTKKSSLEELNKKHADCIQKTMEAVEKDDVRNALTTLSEGGGLLEGAYGTAKALENASYLFDKAQAFKGEEAIRFAASYHDNPGVNVPSYRDLDAAYSKARRKLVEATDKVSKQSKEYGDTLHHIRWMISEFRQRLAGVSFYNWNSDVPSSVAKMVAGKVEQASTFLKFTHTGRVEKADTEASVKLVKEAIAFFEPAEQGRESLYDGYAKMYNEEIKSARESVEAIVASVNVEREAVPSKQDHIKVWKELAKLLMEAGCPEHYYQLLESDEFVGLLVNATDTPETLKENLARYAKGRHPSALNTDDMKKMAIAILKEIKKNLESLSESVGTEELVEARKLVKETANELDAHAKLLKDVQSILNQNTTLGDTTVAEKIWNKWDSRSAYENKTEPSRGESVTSVEWYGVSDLPMMEAAGEAKVFSRFLVSATTAIDNFVKVRVEPQSFRKPPATAALQPTDDAKQLAKDAMEALVGAYSQLDEYVASIYSLEEGNTAFKHAQMKRTILDLASMPPFQYPAFQKTEAVVEGKSTSGQLDPSSVSYQLNQLVGMAGEDSIDLVQRKTKEDLPDKDEFVKTVFDVWSRVLLLVNLCGLQEVQLEAACKMRSLSLSKMSLLQMQMLADQAHVCANYLTREAGVQFDENDMYGPFDYMLSSPSKDVKYQLKKTEAQSEQEEQKSDEKKEKARQMEMRRKRVVNAFEAHQRWFEYRLTDTDIVAEFERFATMLSKAVANDASYESRLDDLHPDALQETETQDDMHPDALQVTETQDDLHPDALQETETQDDMQTEEQSAQGRSDVQNFEKEQALAFLQSLDPMAADDTVGLHSLLEEAQEHDSDPKKRSAPTQRDKDAYKFVVGLEMARNRLAELESRSEQSAVRGWRLLFENVCKKMASRLMDETLAACNLCGMAMLLLLDQIATTQEELPAVISTIDRQRMLPTIVSLDAKRRSFEVATSGEEAYGASGEEAYAASAEEADAASRDASEAYEKVVDFVFKRLASTKGLKGDAYAVEEANTVMAHSLEEEGIPKHYIDKNDGSVNLKDIEETITKGVVRADVLEDLKANFPTIDLVAPVNDKQKQQAALNCLRRLLHSDFVQGVVQLRNDLTAEGVTFVGEQNKWKTDLIDAIVSVELFSGERREYSEFLEQENEEIQTELSSGMQADAGLVGDVEMDEDGVVEDDMDVAEAGAASSSGVGVESEGKYGSLMDQLLSISAFKAEESVVSRMLAFFNQPRTLLIGGSQPLNFLARTSRPMLSPMKPSTLHAESLDEAIQTVVFSAFAKAESKFMYNDTLEGLGQAGGTDTDIGPHYSKVYNMESEPVTKQRMMDDLNNILGVEELDLKLDKFPFEMLSMSKEEDGQQLQTAVFTIPCRYVESLESGDAVRIVGTATAEVGVFFDPVFHKGHQTDLDKHNVKIGVSVKLKVSELDDSQRSSTKSSLARILSYLTLQRVDSVEKKLMNLQRIFPPREDISRMHENCAFSNEGISEMDLASRFFVVQGPVAGIGRLVTASFIQSSIESDGASFPDKANPYPAYLIERVPMTYTFEDKRTTDDKVNLLQAYYDSAAARAARSIADTTSLGATLTPRLNSMSLSETESEPMALAKAMPPSKIGQMYFEVMQLTVVEKVTLQTEETPSNFRAEQRYKNVNLGNVLSTISRFSIDLIEDTEIVDKAANLYMLLTQPRDGMLSNLIQSVEKGRRLRAREKVKRRVAEQRENEPMKSQTVSTDRDKKITKGAGSAFQL